MEALVGYLFTINTILTWAFASLIYKFGLKKTQAKGNVFFRLCCVSIGTFLFAIIFSNFAIIINLNDTQKFDLFIACLISGVSVSIGDLGYFIALQKIDASRAYPLTQLSLVFVYPLAFIFFGEEIELSLLIGGTLILSSVFLLSKKDKPIEENKENEDQAKISKDLITGVVLSLVAALLWALAYVSFNQARIITGDVFVPNFLRVALATIFIGILSIFQRDYLASFRKENRKFIKYSFYIGIAGALSLGLADSLFIKAAEINGLIVTSTLTASTPLVQQIFSVIILKEKFRKRFLFAIILILLGNYIILFL